MKSHMYNRDITGYCTTEANKAHFLLVLAKYIKKSNKSIKVTYTP